MVQRKYEGVVSTICRLTSLVVLLMATAALEASHAQGCNCATGEYVMSEVQSTSFTYRELACSASNSTCDPLLFECTHTVHEEIIVSEFLNGVQGVLCENIPWDSRVRGQSMRVPHRYRFSGLLGPCTTVMYYIVMRTDVNSQSATCGEYRRERIRIHTYPINISVVAAKNNCQPCENPIAPPFFIDLETGIIVIDPILGIT